VTRFSLLAAFSWIALATWPAGPAKASTSQTELDMPQDILFSAAKRYVLGQFVKSTESASKVIKLEDASAGLLRFSYRDGTVSVEDALIEVVDLDGSRSRLKITLPGDYSGRSELMLQKIRRAAAEGSETAKPAFTHDAKKVYRTVLRHVLKTYVSPTQKKEDVLFVASEDVGLIRFAYQRGGFRDPNAAIEITPAGPGASHIRVSLPADPGRQVLLENEVLSAVRADLGEERRPEPDAKE
jgi:hypothetical protein